MEGFRVTITFCDFIIIFFRVYFSFNKNITYICT
nr:MAG TPA: hypothetical protein [Bacteriophage sp.]